MINNNEIVPAIPPLLPGYIHIAKRTYIFKENNTLEIKKKLSFNPFNSYSISDHFTNSILKNIFYHIKQQ